MEWIGKWVAFYTALLSKQLPDIHTPTAVPTMQGNNRRVKSS